MTVVSEVRDSGGSAPYCCCSARSSAVKHSEAWTIDRKEVDREPASEHSAVSAGDLQCKRTRKQEQNLLSCVYPKHILHTHAWCVCLTGRTSSLWIRPLPVGVKAVISRCTNPMQGIWHVLCVGILQRGPVDSNSITPAVVRRGDMPRTRLMMIFLAKQKIRRADADQLWIDWGGQWPFSFAREPLGALL